MGMLKSNEQEKEVLNDTPFLNSNVMFVLLFLSSYIPSMCFPFSVSILPSLSRLV